jgi:hypothetical protein
LNSGQFTPFPIEHFPGKPQLAGLPKRCQQKTYQYVHVFSRKRLSRQRVTAHITVPDRALIKALKTRNIDSTKNAAGFRDFLKKISLER